MLWGNIQCQLLLKGVGDTYLVEDAGDRSILRVYNPGHRTLPQINEEINLLLNLHQAGLPVSYPIRDTKGTIVHTVQTEQGPKHAVLFTFAPGSSVNVLNEAQLREFGLQMARFHHVSSTLPLGSDRWTFDSETTLFTPLIRLKDYFAGLPDEYAWLQDAAVQVARSVERMPVAAASTGYCHFDFLPKNFHFEGDSITFFDFDFMGYGWLIYDIVSYWQHLQIDVYAGRLQQQAADQMFDIFLTAYRQQRSLHEEEIRIIPYLTLGFWLFYMGFHTTHEQFLPHLQPPKLKAYTGFLKSLAQQHWK